MRTLRRFPWKSRSWLFLAASAAGVLVLAFAAFAFFRAQRSLKRATAEVAQSGRYAFDLRTLGRIENSGFESIASPASYVSGAFLRGKLYVSGPSGLSVYGAGDALLKTYRVGPDLPSAPLGAMVVGRLRGYSEPALLIATVGAGVLLFSPDDQGIEGSFRQLLPRDAEARNVTSLLPLPSGELLIGTEHRGLLVYRGMEGSDYLESFHAQLAGLAVTALALDDDSAGGFWVGTRNRGVRHWHGGQMDSFEAARDESASGPLPDQQVEAIAVHGDRVFVGTPLGVAEFDHGRPGRVLARNMFAHALIADDKGLTLGTMDSSDGSSSQGGIQRLSLESERRPGAASGRVASVQQDFDGAPQQFLNADSSGDTVYAVLRTGLRRRQATGEWTPLSLATDGNKTAVLTDGNISALAFAPDGKLWVGFFDRGLDILSTTGQPTEHREDDHLFCVNRIVVDPRRKTMVVATANGLVLFDQQGKARQVMTKKDGLIADHVTDIAFSRESMVLATPAGVTYVDTAGARSLYGFQGLVNNHVYALGARAESSEVLAGTLGGISVLVNEDVQRNLTAANSGLQHNWVTAILPLTDKSDGGRWMVGTYGAGVLELDQNGHFTPMDGVSQAMVVNPNAMLQTRDHVFAGTLGKGLWVWSRNSGRWRQITAGLPSENVTAIAESSGEIYVGTENGLVRIHERLLD